MIHDDEKCENPLSRNTALCSTGAVHLHKEGDNKVHKSLTITYVRILYLEVVAVLHIGVNVAVLCLGVKVAVLLLGVEDS